MDDIKVTTFFEIFRLIILNNQFNEQSYLIYNKKWWQYLLNKTNKVNLIHEIINILHYNYSNFVNLIKKIDKKIDIIDDILQFLLLSNYDNNKLNDFFFDLWFIK